MKLLEGKKGLVVGVLNNKSIAWGITKAVVENGATIAMTYQGEVGKKRVEPLAEEIGCKLTASFDMSVESDIENLFEILDKEFGKLDFLVHSVAFSDKNELRGKFYDTTRDNFKNTMDISCYSLVMLTKKAIPLMEKAGGGSILTMTYYGSEKVMPNYNVMGVAKAALESSVRYLAADLGEKNIRVNALSSGCIKTLASSGIDGISYMLKYSEINYPLRRNVTPEDNGDAAIFLLSDMAKNITGEVLHLDSGLNIMGMKNPMTENIEIDSNITL